jgi:hypothetical protein
VFGGQGFSLTKTRLQAKEAWDKVGGRCGAATAHGSVDIARCHVRQPVAFVQAAAHPPAHLMLLPSLCPPHQVREAVTFMTRGIKLMGSDIGNAGRLFGKAAMGGWSCCLHCRHPLPRVWASHGGTGDLCYAV